jgi:hypothetical protein
MQQAGSPVYSFNKKGVKNEVVAALSSDYFLMVDWRILPMALKSMKEKVNLGIMPAGFLKVISQALLDNAKVWSDK